MSDVPLRARDGSIKAVAVVDPEDFDRVMAAGRWSLSPRGYAYRRVQVGGVQREIKLHRFVMGCGPGDPMVDHIDRNPLNNRRANLRSATNAQNSQNRRGVHRTSAHRGVFWDGGVRKWRAQGSLNYKTIYIGIFDTEDAAAEAARSWRAINMPFNEELADA